MEYIIILLELPIVMGRDENQVQNEEIHGIWWGIVYYCKLPPDFIPYVLFF